MRDPEQAAHAMGKLLKYVGPDNVLRGTSIAPRVREQHGYPEITPAVRAKIFGLNGAKVSRIRGKQLHLNSD